jgi:hypothetical protein
MCGLRYPDHETMIRAVVDDHVARLQIVPDRQSFIALRQRSMSQTLVAAKQVQDDDAQSDQKAITTTVAVIAAYWFANNMSFVQRVT